MRFLISPEAFDEMRQQDHTPDCFVRPGEYLHHLYVDGVKFVVAPAVEECLNEAQSRGDREAINHLRLHYDQCQAVWAQLRQSGQSLDETGMLGDPPPEENHDGSGRTAKHGGGYQPLAPRQQEESGLTSHFLSELIIRTIHARGRMSGSELANELRVAYSVIAPVLVQMRKLALIDLVGQKGSGDAGFEYEIKPPKGTQALEDAMDKTTYIGPAPVPFDDYVESVIAQTVRNLV